MGERLGIPGAVAFFCKVPATGQEVYSFAWAAVLRGKRLRPSVPCVACFRFTLLGPDIAWKPGVKAVVQCFGIRMLEGECRKVGGGCS